MVAEFQNIFEVYAYMTQTIKIRRYLFALLIWQLGQFLCALPATANDKWQTGTMGTGWGNGIVSVRSCSPNNCTTARVLWGKHEYVTGCVNVMISLLWHLARA